MNLHGLVDSSCIASFGAGVGIHFLIDALGYLVVGVVGAKIGHKCGKKHTNNGADTKWPQK